MANIKSAIKRARQNTKRYLHNRSLMSAYRTDLKKFMVFLEGKDVENAEKGLPSIHKSIDRAFSKGLLKKNTASRKKSRMTIAVNQLRKAAS